MKKKIFCIFILIAITLGTFTITVSAQTTLKLNGSKVTLGVGETYQVTATTNSSNEVKWSTSDKIILTVSNTGLVSAKAVGSADITAKVDGESALFTFVVKKAPDTISAKDITVSVNNTADIKITLPSGTASKNLTYKSSDIKIAKVNSKGTVTGIKEGSCTITITTFNGQDTKIKVKITDEEALGNGSDLVVYKDCIYFRDSLGMSGLFKASINGGEKIKLTQDTPYYGTGITVIDDCIYYTNHDDNKFYRININGSDRKKLHDGGAYNIQIVDDWLYFSDYYNIYRMHINGTEKQKLTYGRYFQIINGWIYSVYPGNGIYKVQINGKNASEIKRNVIIKNGPFEREEEKSIECSNLLTIIDDWIYYYSGEGYYSQICKIKKDGTEYEIIYDKSPNNLSRFNIEENWIYFYNGATNKYYRINMDGSKEEENVKFNNKINGNYIIYSEDKNSDTSIIYRVKKDGIKKEKIVECMYPSRYFVRGDWIYYYKKDCNIYKIKIDGSGDKKICAVEWGSK